MVARTAESKSGAQRARMQSFHLTRYGEETLLTYHVSSCATWLQSVKLLQGHTSSIYAARFMPNSGNEQIITSAADRQVRSAFAHRDCQQNRILCSPDPAYCLQIRHVNLHRHAVKPYACHSGKVKALLPLDAGKLDALKVSQHAVAAELA